MKFFFIYNHILSLIILIKVYLLLFYYLTYLDSATYQALDQISNHITKMKDELTLIKEMILKKVLYKNYCKFK